MNTQRARTAIHLSLLLILALLPVQAAAEGFDVGFDIGFTEFDDEVDGDGASYVPEFRADIRLGYFFNDKFELEVQLIGSNEDAELDAVMLNALYHFKTDGTKVPYVLVGVGTVNLDLGFFGSWRDGVKLEDDGFGYQAGLGVRFFFSRAKRSYFRLEGLALAEDTFDETSVHLSLTGGFGWQF